MYFSRVFQGVLVSGPRPHRCVVRSVPAQHLELFLQLRPRLQSGSFGRESARTELGVWRRYTPRFPKTLWELVKIHE